jgi:Domain of unknown function (DUF4397)
MKSATLAGRVASVATAAALTMLGLAVTQVAAAAPIASASSQVGWIRLAHFSPNTPAVDVYLYSFGNPKAEIVLHHVKYGVASPFEQVAAGDYTVAMRGAGAAPASKPVLSTAVDIAAGHAYTVAGMGPYSSIRLQVIGDRLRTPRGKALVRIIQASLLQDTVTITAGTTKLASNLKFASVTGFIAVNPGTWAVRAAGSSESTTASIALAAGSIHTIVVLDEPGKLGLDDLLDAAGSKVIPAGAPPTGFGGTAARPGAALLPWAAAAAAGLAIALTGTAVLGRRRRPALHAR